MTIAFDNQVSSSLSYSDGQSKEIQLNDDGLVLTMNSQGQCLKNNQPDNNPRNANPGEAQLFQQLLSDQESQNLINVPSPINTTPINTSLNNTVLSQLGINSTSSHTSSGFASAVSNSPASQIATAISGPINSLAMTSATGIHSFSVILPGQANLNVSTQVLASGVRSLQLDSDEKKFQTWLQENVTELSQALSQELNSPVQLSIGATA